MVVSYRLENTSGITAFDGDPGDLMVFGDHLFDFLQSCVKTIALAYTEKESWCNPVWPDVPVMVFSAWCPALPCFTHPQMHTACSWVLPWAVCAFPWQLLLAEMFPEASREV